MVDSPVPPVPKQIEAQAQALTARLASVARAAVADSLKNGAILSVPDLVNTLKSLEESLPPALVAAIDDELPVIAARAIEGAQSEIADAREASGKQFPSVAAPKATDYNYLGWAATAAAALVGALTKAATAAGPDQPAADQLKIAKSAVDQAAADAEAHIGPMADTAAARGFNDARESTFNVNDDIVSKLKFMAVEDSKTSEMCQHLDGAEFSLRSSKIIRPPLHPGCRSHLAAVMGVTRKKGATQKEIDRQNWAIFRRLERESKAQAEGRSMEHLEVRFAPGMADGAAGTFTGYAATWGELDRHGTAFAPGAFFSSLSEHRSRNSRLPMLWNHSPDQVVGSWDSIEEDANGLKVRGRLVLNTRAGAEAYSLLKAGALNGLSVGFRRLRDQARPGGGRTITAADLAEISLVGIPSNSSARITEVRAAPNAAPGAAHAPDCHPHKNHRKEGAMPDTHTPAPAAADDNTAAAVAALNLRLDKLEARAARTGMGAGDAHDATGELEKRAFVNFVRRGAERIGADEIRSLKLSDDTAGGYLAPPEFSTEMIKNLVQFSPIRQLARVGNTSAQAVLLPKRVGNLTAQWVGETDERPATGPTYGQGRFQVAEGAAYVDISNQMLEDSAIDIAAELSADLAEEFGRLEGAAFINGSGALQPAGLMTNPDISYTPTDAASAVTADSIIQIFHDLPSFYRAGATWIMNSQTMAAVRKLKDPATGTLLLLTSGIANAPATTLLGRPVVECVDMPDVAANSFPILFGDFSNYRIFDRMQLSVLRDPYSLATSGQTRFHARRRLAAGVAKAEAFRKLKIAAS